MKKANFSMQPPLEPTKVRKNQKGGVLVTPDEIKMAFEFLDADKSGKISLANLKKRIGVFFPNMTAKEYRFLMNGRKDITLNDLSELLVDNEITNFDPVAEAFKAYDPLGEGKIDPAKLRDVFENFGGSSISDAELDVVKRAADLDSDGIISQDDFRYMLDMHRVKNIPVVVTPDPLEEMKPSTSTDDEVTKEN